jgi:DNA invertase Pin-like site-specific DNA recombinase
MARVRERWRAYARCRCSSSEATPAGLAATKLILATSEPTKSGLARSGIRDTFEVVEELRRHGVELVSVSDGFSVDGPAAEVVLAVMAWAAKMERLAINERISAARERVEAEGKQWGRPRRLDEESVARAKAMKAAGRSVREIAVALKVPRSTVARAVAAAP